jgi:hypothetical protein
MGFDEYVRSCRRQRLLIDQAQAAVLAAVDYARIAGHATVTLDEHQTPASRAAAAAAHTRANHAARTALDAVARLATPDPDTEPPWISRIAPDMPAVHSGSVAADLRH